jgi:AraC-like DNA-binding protein
VLLNQLGRAAVAALDSEQSSLDTALPQIFFSQQPQALRAVTILQPSALWVLEGHKWVTWGGIRQSVPAGDLLVLAPGDRLQLQNLPGPSGRYLALMLQWSPAQIDQFLQLAQASDVLQTQSAPKQCNASPAQWFALQQWLEARHYFKSAELLQLRQLELLWLIAHAGSAGRLLRQTPASWSQRVAALLSQAPEQAWRMPSVAARLNQSEASLRRRLAAENTHFRSVLEQVRLQAALRLLTHTQWPLTQIAQQVGYESPARFSERFESIYGLRPNQYRATQRAKN